MNPTAIALTIAGNDPSGGAGLQADLKTFQQLGVYGMGVITLLTVQNTQRVSRVEPIDAQLVLEQLDAVLTDIPPKVIKLGALGTPEIATQVADRLGKTDIPIVVDPVLVSKHGDRLANDDMIKVYRNRILPLAYLVTPNRFEAELITGLNLSNDDSLFHAVCDSFLIYGAAAVLIKTGDENQRVHYFSETGQSEITELQVESLASNSVHGAGCVLSAIVTSALALGLNRQQAVLFAIEKTFEAISVGCSLGKGTSPVDVRAIRNEFPCN